jgi:lysophospholipid acyltransferase (LPLAT)-like uncharacterized protein
LRWAPGFPKNAAVSKKPDDGLRNTIYEQQTRSGRQLTRTRLFLYQSLVPLALGLIRLVWGWARVVRLSGVERIAGVLAENDSFIPVYWHQQQLFCVKTLLEERRSGVKLGFLISPSVDGEIGALLVRRLGGEVIRGSSSHTGARALRDYYQALAQQGISPAITPDGPKGPPWKVKPGAVLLAQMSKRPIIPMAYAASRAWHIQWDRFVIPKPFARIAIMIGEPIYIPKGLDAAALERHQRELEERLMSLTQAAKAALT